MVRFNGKKNKDMSDTHTVKSVATSHFTFGGSLGKTTGGFDRMADTMEGDLFVDPETKQAFDPSEKFGVINKDTSKHFTSDNITTSYPVDLPNEYYKGYIDKSLPHE
jgi:hypothetical protein